MAIVFYKEYSWIPTYRIDQSTIGKTLSVSTGHMGGFMTDDGLYYFSTDEVSNKIIKYTLSIPYDITSATGTTQELTGQSTPHQCCLNPQGTKIYIANYGNNTIYTYTLSTPYNLSSASLTHTFSLSRATACILSSDGLHMIAASNGQTIYHYTLSTARDLSTATQMHSIAAPNSECRGLAISKDGLHLYKIYSSNIYQYDLTSPYNISSLPGQYSKTIGFGGCGVVGNITSDGKYLMITDRRNSGGYIYRIDLPGIS